MKKANILNLQNEAMLLVDPFTFITQIQELFAKC